MRIADNAEATTCGSSASSLSRDTFARRAPSRSAREAGVAPSPIAREEVYNVRRRGRQNFKTDANFAQPTRKNHRRRESRHP